MKCKQQMRDLTQNINQKIALEGLSTIFTATTTTLVSPNVHFSNSGINNQIWMVSIAICIRVQIFALGKFVTFYIRFGKPVQKKQILHF